MNSEDQHDLVRLTTAANPFQAHIWLQALQGEGIRCQVLGDYLDAGIGDIPGHDGRGLGRARRRGPGRSNSSSTSTRFQTGTRNQQ
jgi:hypothetical protein